MKDLSQYHTLSKLFHWTIAALIVLQYVLHEAAEYAEESGSMLRELALIANHKSVGITVLTLALLRLAWRLIAAPPKLPNTMPKWQVAASHISHWSLYILMFALPITGWLMSSAYGFSVSWFNLIQLPDFVEKAPALADRLEDIHEILAKTLFVIAVVHILGALKHAIVDKDGVLARMTSAPTVVTGIVVLAGGAWWLTTPGESTGSRDVVAAAASPTNSPADAPSIGPSSDLPLWDIDYAASSVRFTGDQAGASFDGVWQEWTAELRFDGNNLAAGAFEVTINTGAVEANDEDRNSTLKTSEWFDVANHPEAFYRAFQFRQEDSGFAADGQLVIKGKATPVILRFTVETDGHTRVLMGTAELSRLELGVGVGEWEDTTWVSDEVRVDVRVEATVAGD
ncbi:MAG: cytochrome b/b6 domain-containing protein [Pseudomonadota bacterium]